MPVFRKLPPIACAEIVQKSRLMFACSPRLFKKSGVLAGVQKVAADRMCGLSAGQQNHRSDTAEQRKYFKRSNLFLEKDHT